MKQRFLTLWTKRGRLFVAAVALALAFSLGMFAQSCREDARREAALEEQNFYALRGACVSMEALRDLYGAVNDRSAPLSGPAALSVASMRHKIGVLRGALPEMELQWEDYPEVFDYLHWLTYDLLAAECPDYESFGPLAEAAGPLMDAVHGTESLDEALTAIADRLATDEGQAILNTLLPCETAA